MTITGLPEVAANVSSGSGSVSVPYYKNFAGLTSSMIGRVTMNTSQIELFDSKTTETLALTNANLSDTSEFELTIEYVYQ